MRRTKFLLIIFAFILSTLACQLSTGLTPPRSLNISQTEAKNFETATTFVKLNPSSGLIIIPVTESQVTSYLTYKMSDQISTYLQNPQVYFETDQIHLYGTYQSEFVQAEGRIIITVNIINQVPKFSILSANFGPIPIPGPFLSMITEQLDKEVEKAILKTPSDYPLDSITVKPGELILTLKKKGT